MTASVRLLGRPGIERDSIPVAAPRGNKVWALLAYLVLTERPPTRQHLVSLLCADAMDPLRALRWNISELRRALRGIATIDGDPLILAPLPTCGIDVRQLTDGSSTRALALESFGHELLEGITLRRAPAFEAWLAAERCRITACSEAVLVERALDLLAAGFAAAAARLAARAVAMNPLSPDHHTVLLRSLTAAGGWARSPPSGHELHRSLPSGARLCAARRGAGGGGADITAAASSGHSRGGALVPRRRSRVLDGRGHGSCCRAAQQGGGDGCRHRRPCAAR